jgi:hypothetical protein
MQDLTKGPIVRNVLQMASFMLVSMVFQTLYFLVDPSCTSSGTCR